MRSRVRTGLELLLASPPPVLKGRKIGLIAHPASVLPDLRHAADAVRQCPDLDLRALFGPQHGARGEKQDNMVESDDYRDPRTGLPVHSLYGAVRKPTPAMMEGLDALVFDLQDVGVRVYTFAWTMLLAMEACSERGIPFVVLDRPNPVGASLREGAVLKPGYESFVGLHSIPLRHGLTMGELARLLVAELGLRCPLEVIACDGWSRDDWFDATGLPYVMPSPNLPTLDSCAVYPGTVLLEGTNLSEGRGTTRPFEIVGAPYLRADDLAERLNARQLPGVAFRACWFEPTFQKHAGRLCGGVQIHVLDRAAFRPVHATVALLRDVMDLAPSEFRWREPPYEYEARKPPIDILWGSDELRRRLDDGEGPEQVLATEAAEMAAFAERARPYLNA